MNILEVMVRIMSPILSFTCDEVWEHYPSFERGREGRPSSVQLAGWPVDADFAPAMPSDFDAEAFMNRFATLLEARDVVTKALEDARNDKVVNKSQEAEILIEAPEAVASVLAAFDATDLEELFIVSKVSVSAVEGDAMRALVSKTDLPKCPRCWNHRELGGNEGHADVCRRCGDVLDAVGA